VALFNLHKYQQAQQEFVIALELAPQWVEAQMWLGKCLFAQNQTSLAIIEYRKALAKAQLNWYEPDTPLLADLHYQLGMAYVDKGYLEQGLAEFQHSLAVYPSSKAELAIKNMPHNKPLAREDR
jgi:tetratricopeptide (TPR) repeat protein